MGGGIEASLYFGMKSSVEHLQKGPGNCCRVEKLETDLSNVSTRKRKKASILPHHLQTASSSRRRQGFGDAVAAALLAAALFGQLPLVFLDELLVESVAELPLPFEGLEHLLRRHPLLESLPHRLLLGQLELVLVLFLKWKSLLWF